MNKQTILFFDIDLTLIHNKFANKVLRQLLSEMIDSSKKTIELLGYELNQENTRRQQEDPDNVLTMDWNDMVEQMAKKYDVTLSNTVDQLWLDAMASDGVEVLDDAPTVLERLKADHRKLVIATKGLSKYQDCILEGTGLLAHFDDVLTPDKTGYLKTSPEYFNKYNAMDATFIHIGDHYYDDVICAKRNGFYSVMRAPIDELKDYPPFDRPQHLTPHLSKIRTYPDAGSDVRPDAIVLSLQEVPAVVEQIEAPG